MIEKSISYRSSIYYFYFYFLPNSYGRIRSEVTKDEALAGKQITPEQFADMILASIQGQNLISSKTAQSLWDALIAVAEDMRKADGEEREERGQNLKFIGKKAGSFAINQWIGLDRDDLVQIGSMTTVASILADPVNQGYLDFGFAHSILLKCDSCNIAFFGVQ